MKDNILEVIIKDIESVYKIKEFLKWMIENKVYIINEKEYKVEVKELMIYMRLFVEIYIFFVM